jgi:hypothetical protein
MLDLFSPERALRKWRPDKENDQAPHLSLLSAAPNLEGYWGRFMGFDSASLEFTRREDGRFDVRFSSGGCLGGLDLTRTAEAKEGTILLDLPVREYAGTTYQRLYVVRVQGKEYLLPDRNVKRFEASLTKDRKAIRSGCDAHFEVYQRKEKRQSAPARHKPSAAGANSAPGR